MPFKDRLSGAYSLVEKLEDYRDENPLILAVPRGGVPIAAALVNSLGGELDIILAKKFYTPAQTEVPIGVVTEFGDVFLAENQHSALNPSFVGMEPEDFQSLVGAEVQALKKQRQLYAPLVPLFDPEGRSVIVVAEALQTGVGALAIVESLRKKNPRQIVMATPLATPEAVSGLSAASVDVEVGEIVTNRVNIREAYRNLSSLTDDDVIHILSESRKLRPYSGVRGREVGFIEPNA